MPKQVKKTSSTFSHVINKAAQTSLSYEQHAELHEQGMLQCHHRTKTDSVANVSTSHGHSTSITIHLINIITVIITNDNIITNTDNSRC